MVAVLDFQCGCIQRPSQGFYIVRSTSGVVFQDFERAMEWTLALSHSHTHTHTEGSLVLTSQTSKLAVPWGTSNAGEAIKRQKLFSVRSWFIWLKNETTNPTDIIFPSQGLLYQAEPKLLPGGNPLKSRKDQPEELKLSCLLLSSLLWLHISFCFYLFFQDAICSLTHKKECNHTISSLFKPSCLVWRKWSLVWSASMQSLATISQWRKNKRGGEWVCWVCLREIRRPLREWWTWWSVCCETETGEKFEEVI